MGNYIKDYIRQIEFKMTLKNNIIDIENYTELGNISDKEIIIFDNSKRIIIKGRGLSIAKMYNNEILITGSYNNIIFEVSNE